jgi:allantoicase
VIIDLASRAWGGIVEEASNQHYGPATQVNSPYPPLNMFDGLESARSRVAGSFEHVALKLGAPGVVQEIQLDFTYFVNNNPRDVVVELETAAGWEEVYRGFSKPFAGNIMSIAVGDVLATRVRLKCYPCGGVNRIRVLGMRT